MGHAFCELIVRYPAKQLPKTGGLNATMLVLIDEDSLMGRVEKAGILDTGEKISPAHGPPVGVRGRDHPRRPRRRLPAPRRRPRAALPHQYQRYAMLARDRGCRAEGCDSTTGLHIHHKTRWADGGDTNSRTASRSATGTTTRPTTPTYETTYQPNGDVTFHRRR